MTQGTRFSGFLVVSGLLAACSGDGASMNTEEEGDGVAAPSDYDLESPPAAGEPGPAGPSEPDVGTDDGVGSGASTDAPSAEAGGDAPAPGTPAVGLPVPGPSPGIPSGQSGLLTAGTWDDNRNLARFLDYREELLGQQMNGMPTFEEAEHIDVQEQGIGEPRAHASLDVALVIDTTGSMGDELAYLQTEFDALSSAIEDAYPEAKQRWSLVLYRDQGDEYVTRSYDFRTDMDEFRGLLAEQSANGGGDFPEAPEEALAVMTELGWRSSDNTARLAFWVGDAPHHDNDASSFADAVRASQALDIHVYPVASSGVDELTEFSMRATAQLTGGRYIFLTNDSGVGGDHKEPSIPCYFVTRLDHAILRMVQIEMSGDYSEPDADEILRTGGNPQNGACELESGQVVTVF